MSIYEKQLEEEKDNWNGIERRLSCQGCSAIYSKLLRSEKLNLQSHKEIYKLNYRKLSKRTFYFFVVVVVFSFFLSFKFRSDFEYRYISSLESSNKELQKVIFGLDDLINTMESVNKKIIFSEEDFEDKIKELRKEVDKTQEGLTELQEKLKSKKEKR